MFRFILSVLLISFFSVTLPADDLSKSLSLLKAKLLTLAVELGGEKKIEGKKEIDWNPIIEEISKEKIESENYILKGKHSLKNKKLADIVDEAMVQKLLDKLYNNFYAFKKNLTIPFCDSKLKSKKDLNFYDTWFSQNLAWISDFRSDISKDQYKKDENFLFMNNLFANKEELINFFVILCFKTISTFEEKIGPLFNNCVKIFQYFFFQKQFELSATYDESKILLSWASSTKELYKKKCSLFRDISIFKVMISRAMFFLVSNITHYCDKFTINFEVKRDYLFNNSELLSDLLNNNVILSNIKLKTFLDPLDDHTLPIKSKSDIVSVFNHDHIKNYAIDSRFWVESGEQVGTGLSRMLFFQINSAIFSSKDNSFFKKGENTEQYVLKDIKKEYDKFFDLFGKIAFSMLIMNEKIYIPVPAYFHTILFNKKIPEAKEDYLSMLEFMAQYSQNDKAEITGSEFIFATTVYHLYKKFGIKKAEDYMENIMGDDFLKGKDYKEDFHKEISKHFFQGFKEKLGIENESNLNMLKSFNGGFWTFLAGGETDSKKRNKIFKVFDTTNNNLIKSLEKINISSNNLIEIKDQIQKTLEIYENLSSIISKSFIKENLKNVFKNKFVDLVGIKFERIDQHGEILKEMIMRSFIFYHALSWLTAYDFYELFLPIINSEEIIASLQFSELEKGNSIVETNFGKCVINSIKEYLKESESAKNSDSEIRKHQEKLQNFLKEIKGTPYLSQNDSLIINLIVTDKEKSKNKKIFVSHSSHTCSQTIDIYLDNIYKHVREYNDNGYNAKKDDLLKDNAFLNDKGFIDIVRKYLLEKELPQWDGSSLGGIA